MWLKWFPWRYAVRRAASSHGLLDPIAILSRLHRFAEPSEVAAPLELLRAGVVFHARGLMNTGAIQHNLDWVWPYWVERQFNPVDEAFIPRAFSITHVNLTHRNWTAVGLPDCDWFPLVDPRGLLMPFWDSWSLDAWLIGEDRRQLLPSQTHAARQTLDLDGGLAVLTQCADEGLALRGRVEMIAEGDAPVCRLSLTGTSATRGWLVVTLRPYNPEGVSFIHEVAITADRRAWNVEGVRSVQFSEPAQRHLLSTYRQGDVHQMLLSDDHDEAAEETKCDVGMATAAALFALRPDEPREIEVRVPASADPNPQGKDATKRSGVGWTSATQGAASLRVPDARYQLLFDAAVRTLVLHTPGEVFAGPYTYKRFWIRDAVFILSGLAAVGLLQRARRLLEVFPKHQTRRGYFRSQEGEWDSNGEVLWILDRVYRQSGTLPLLSWQPIVRRAVRWIERKRLSDKLEAPHAGLLPAGFSAEHLGPNDYYYWDDFWSVGGLRAAARLLDQWGDLKTAARAQKLADRLMSAVERSLAVTQSRRNRPGIPASPYRRLDSGAIGSLAAGYPLEVLAAGDPSLLATVDFLLENCMVNGGFFQDMIHSGINPYLTLHIAQVLLRAGDLRALDLMRTVASLASSTGQWPEAVHPRTRGGCMGDGQHVWAASEWLLMIRNCFVREEGDRLILASGIPAAWLEQTEAISFGPAPTLWGDVTVYVLPSEDEVAVRWETAWHAEAPPVEVNLPGFELVRAPQGAAEIVLGRAAVS